MDNVAVVMLTWNRRKILENTIKTFKNFHPKFPLEDIIIVDNGSTDGTKDDLIKSPYDFINLEENVGAQRGKYIGWNKAVQRGFQYIIFIEDDHPCIRTVPLNLLIEYLKEYKGVGIIRLNNKKYLKKHVITHLPIKKYETTRLSINFNVIVYDYHFTSHPSIFRASLVEKLSGCIYPGKKPRVKIPANVLQYENSLREEAISRLNRDFGVAEKEYMRMYSMYYNYTGQLKPACFQFVETKASRQRKRSDVWKN